MSPVLQQRRAGQHLGAAIQLVRRRPGLFASLGALLPVAGLAAAAAQWLIAEHTELGDAFAVTGAGSPWGTAVAAFIGLVFIVPVTSIVYVAIAAVVRDLAAGATASWRRGLVAVRDHPRGVLTELLTRALINTLLFTVVLSPFALVLLARWCVVAPASLDSRHPARRSAALTHGQRFRTGALAALITTLSISLPVLSATILLILTSWSFLLVNVVTSLVAAVVIPVAAVTIALLHGDLVLTESAANAE